MLPLQHKVPLSPEGFLIGSICYPHWKSRAVITINVSPSMESMVSGNVLTKHSDAQMFSVFQGTDSSIKVQPSCSSEQLTCLVLFCERNHHHNRYCVQGYQARWPQCDQGVCPQLHTPLAQGRSEGIFFGAVEAH